jgi:hypothetical protein
VLAAGGVELIVGKPLGHGSLGNTIGQDGSTGKFQRFGEGRLGHSFILMVLNVGISGLKTQANHE